MKTNTVKHTPTPWNRNVSPAWKYPIYADKNGDPNGRDWIHIAAVLSGNPNAEADLDFIVKAVNSHEALLEAAKLALIALDGLPFKKNFDARNVLQAAISQAEGE